jgi:hypothetical protein
MTSAGLRDWQEPISFRSRTGACRLRSGFYSGKKRAWEPLGRRFRKRPQHEPQSGRCASASWKAARCEPGRRGQRGLVCSMRKRRGSADGVEIASFRVLNAPAALEVNRRVVRGRRITVFADHGLPVGVLTSVCRPHCAPSDRASLSRAWLCAFLQSASALPRARARRARREWTKVREYLSSPAPTR